MKNYFKGLPVIPTAVFLSCVFLLLRFIKIGSIIGSPVSVFSLSDIAMPLSGNLGFGFIGVLVALRYGLRLFISGAPTSVLVYHLPGICASSYWATENKIISLILPFLCMVAFIVHPVGFYAAPYALYWLIPMVLYFVKEKNAFMHALSSTFIAHCVGSVLYLYTLPMTSAQWLALIPRVAVERFVFACAMAVLYVVCSTLKEKLLSWSAAVKIKKASV